MVEDNFKIGIDLEIEQSSLANLEKQISNAIKNAAERGAKDAGLSPLGGVGTGAATSAKAATGVSGADFAKSIRGIMKGELSGFAAAAKEITTSVNNLTSALNKQQAASKGAAPATPAKQKGPARSSKLQDELDNLALTVAVEQQNAKEHANDLKKASKSLQKAQAAQDGITKLLEQEQKDTAASRAKAAQLRAAEDNLITSTNTLAAARSDAASQTRKGGGPLPTGGAAVSGVKAPLQIIKDEARVGGSNRNAHKQKINRATDGGRQESASSLTTPTRTPNVTGDGPTDTKAKRATQEIDRKGKRDYKAQAEIDATNIASALKEAEKAILSAIPSFKNRDLRGEFGLPAREDVRVAPGAVPTVTNPSGTENMVGMVVKMAGNTISRLDRISANLPEFKNELAGVAKAMVTNKKSGQSQLRALVKNLIGDSQKYEKHQARGQFMRGGEAQLDWKPSDAQAKQILAQGTDVGKIAEIEKIFHGIAAEAEKLNKSGMDTITLMSLTEEAAAALAVTLQKTETGFEGAVSGKIQTRNVRDMGPGGGGMVNPARLLYQKGFSKLEKGGEMPEIASSLEKMAYADGLISKAAKNLVTAAVSFKHIPEVMEDQFLIAASAAKQMGMVKEKSVLVRDRAEDLTVGMGLQQGQVLGTADKAQSKAVTMELKGSAAEITKFTDVWVDGVKMVKISFNELNEMLTGGKLGDRAGHKGIAKVVPDKKLEDMGFEKGTQLVTSIEGLMKRNNLQSMVSMIATSMSDGGNVAAQTIFDSIVKAMESGDEMADAVKSVAKEFGLDAGAAFKATTGQLAEAGVGKVLTGRVAMFRMEKEGQTGEAPIRQRFQDPSGMTAMRQREELSSMADVAQANSSELVIKKQKDYIFTLSHLIDASETLVAGLEKIDPESFAGFDTGGAVDPEMLAGTMLDPSKMKGAFNLQLPKREGGFEDMYVPGMGTAVGQRGQFENEAELVRGSDESNALEKLRATATQIKAARGEIDPTKDLRAQKEGAFRASSFMDEQISAMKEARGPKGGQTSESKALGQKFLAMWMPVIKRAEQMGKKTTGLQFRTFDDEKGTESIKDVRGTPSAYIGKGANDYEKAMRVRDMLGKRALGERKGATQSLASKGALFEEENLDLVVDSMKRMGSSAQESSKYLDQLWGRFDKLKAELLDLYNAKGFGKQHKTPSREESRRVAQTKGSGVMPGAYAKAIEFNVDVSQDLAAAEKQLRSLGAAGVDVGDGLAALERIKSLQISEDAIPKDAVLLSKQDYNNLLSMIKRDAKGRGEKLTDDQARKRLDRVVTHRDPTLGGGSYQIAKVIEDTRDRLPEGKMGIPGAFPISSTADLMKMMKPMKDRREFLKGEIKEEGGVGPRSDAARLELGPLNKQINGLTHSFGAAMQGLDFDGDAMKVFASDSEEASSKLKTSLEILTESGMSLNQAMKTIVGSLEGGGDHDFQSLEGLDDAFRSIVKRPEGQRFARPSEDTGEGAAADATKLVGGKLSVGRLSDAFNILQQALVSGARDTGDAFATGLELMMQQIQKSLATKHGTGDLQGPLELIDTIRQGPAGLNKLFKGMDAGGEGTFGELGRRNQKYRGEIENQLMTKDPAELKAMALKQGIKDAEGMNYDSLIRALVDSLDLKAQFRKMWELIRTNMQKALAAEGMNKGSVNAAMDAMMTDEKDPGLDLFRMQDPAYAMTRKRGAKALRKNKGGPKGIGREIISAMLQDSSEDVSDQMDEFSLDPSGIKSSGQRLSAKVESWLEGIKSTTDELNEQFLKSKGIDPKKAHGRYAYKSSDPTAGRVQISERTRMRPAEASVEALKRIESGSLQATPKLIQFITKSLAELGMTLAHERIHEGSKKFTDSVDMIASSLTSSSGVIGSARESIFKGANKLANVRMADEKLGKLKSIRDTKTAPGDMASALTSVSGIGDKLAQRIVGEFGSETLDVMRHEPERLASVPGIGDQKAAVMAASFKTQESDIRGRLAKRTVPTDDPSLKAFHGMDAAKAAGQQSTKYLRLVAEEIQAHLTNPEKWERVFGGIPGEAKQAIEAALDTLRKASPELIDPIFKAVFAMNSGIVDAYGQAIRGEGTDAAKQVRAEAEGRIDAESFGMGPRRQRIGQFEEALQAGREARGLVAGTADPETGRISRMRPVKFAHEDTLGDTTQSMRTILEDMAAPGAADDPDKRAADKTQFQRLAGSYKTGLKGTSSSDKAWKLHQEAMQEFQAAELEMFINKARDLQDSIAVAKAAGKTEGSDFDAMIKELDKTVDQMYRNMSEARLPGTFGVTNISSDRRGMTTPQAAELDIKPGAGQYTDVIKQASGRDKDSQARFGNMANILEDIKNGLKEDMTFTEAWVQIWDELIRQPEHMRENVGKIIAALGPMAQFMKMEKGPDKATQGLADLGNQAQQTFKILKAGAPIESMEDLNNVIARSSKLKTFAMEGKPLGDAYTTQMELIKAEARSWVKELNDILGQGVEIDAKRLSLGTRDIVDPKTLTVLRKMEVGAKRVGNTFQVSMTQAGKSVNQMSGAMRGALRRVVQWGFATGIVYGTIRAFRAAAQVITEVENKITALKKVMDTSVTNFDKLKNGAVGFAQEFGVSIEEVLDGMVVYGQQGLKVNKIMERTRATMLAVNVTTLSAVDATEALTASHKVFGETMADSTGFVDAWAAVAARHAITAKDLADAVKRSGAAAGVAGVGFNDFLGIVTAIGAVTRQSGKEIATSTKFMFRAMRRPTAQKELGKMGIQSLTPGGDFKPALGILKELAGSWDVMTRAQQVNLAQAMAGIRHYNSFIVLMNNFDEALLASADAANSQGFAMRKNRLAMGTFTKNMNQLKETAKGLAITLGNVLLPIGTGIIELMTGLGAAVAGIHPAILTATSLFAVMGLGLHKGADLISDSMEAMSTGNIGIEADKMSLGRKIGAGIRSMGEGKDAGLSAALGGVGDAGRGTEGLTTLGKGAFYASKGVASLGMTAIRVIPGMNALATALGLSAAAVGGVVLAVLAAAVVGLAVAYQHVTKSAKQYEQEQEKIIGKSEDAASKLRSQKTSADRLTLAYHKIGKAQEAMNDPAGLQAALQEGRFKSAAKAAQDYSNMLSEVSNSMAQLDPDSVRGITESGDYILTIADNFKALTTSALDARNAITMAMKVDLIEKFSEELRTAEGWQDNLAQGFLKIADSVTFGAFDLKPEDAQGNEAYSAMGKLSEVRKEIQKITEEMRKQEASGEYAIERQIKLNSLVAQEVDLRGQVSETAMNIRRILESIPKFEDMDMAMNQISPEAFQNIQGAAATGAFGRGSTGGSVINQFAAEQAGLGGILDYQATQSPGLAASAFLERGIKGKGGAGAVRGSDTNQVLDNEMAVITKQAADALGIQARILWSDLEDTTGDVMYNYWDTTSSSWEKLAGSSVEGVVRGLEGAGGDIAAHFMRFATEEVEAASEATKKMLTLQFSGAMAGIRVPTGGMPDLGPARAADLTVEQRVMKSMPEDLQRLADVQQEFNQLAKEYSEEVLQDVEGAYKRQAKSGTAFKVMTQEILQLATRLQTEGHLITVIGNFQKVSAELAMTLEGAAEAARDANREEDNRAKFLKITSGALAGMAALPALDLGKSMRELTGQERLAKADPAVEAMMRKIAGTERKRDADLQVLNDLQSKLAKFDQSVIDMAAAGDTLSSQQKERIGEAALKDATPGELKMIEALMKEGTESRNIMGDQLSAQQQMLEKMDITNDLLALPEKERAEKFDALVSKAGFKRQSTGFMQQAGAAEWRRLIESTAGITSRPSEDVGERTTAKAGSSAQVQQLAALFNALDVVAKGNPENLQAGPLASVEGQSFGKMSEVEDAINALIDTIYMGDADLALAFKTAVVKRTSSSEFQADLKKNKAKEAETRMAEQQARMAELSVSVRKEIKEAEAKQILSLEAANKELQKKEGFRLAVAVSDFSKSLTDMVLEMEKATMMGEGVKIDSDLDPNTGRVGQPGFKSTFDQRREALKAGSNRPMSLDALRQRDTDRKQLRFDEEEDKIKKKQAVETAALKQIQQQAEKVRDVLATTALDPSIDQGTRNLAQTYFDQLSEELTTSEQAVKQRDGTLKFKGVPGLNELKKFAAQMKQRSQEKAAEAASASVKKGVGGVETRLDTQIRLQKATLAAITGGRGEDYVTAPDTGTGTTAAGTHSQGVGTPRVDFSAGSATPQSTTGGGDLYQAGLVRSLTKQLKERGTPQSEEASAKLEAAVRDMWSPTGRTSGSTAPAEEAGVGVAAAFTLLGMRTKQLAKDTRSVQTAFGKVVAVTNRVKGELGDFINVESRFESVTKEGRAAGFRKGDKVLDQAFEISTGPGGVKTAQAGHIGTEGLHPDLRGKYGIAGQQSRAAGGALQAEGVKKVFSTPEVTSPKVKGMYDAMGESTGGGRARFTEGTQLLPGKEGPSYMNMETGGPAIEVDIGETRPGKYQGLRPDEMQRVQRAQGEDFHVQGRSLQEAQVQEAIDSRPGSKPMARNKLDAMLEAQRKQSADVRAKRQTFDFELDADIGDPNFDEAGVRRAKPLGPEAPVEAPTTRAGKRAAALVEREAAQGVKETAKQKSRLAKISEAVEASEAKKAARASAGKSTRFARPAEEVGMTAGEKFGKSAGRVGRGVGLFAIATEITEAMDIMGSAGLKEDASKEGAQMGGMALLTALGALTVAVGSVPLMIGAAVTTAGVVLSDSLFGTNIMGTAGGALDDLSGGSITDMTKSGGQALIKAFSGNDLAAQSYGAVTAESPEARAHTAFLQTRKPGETRTTEEMNAATAATVAADTERARVSSHQRFLQNRAPGETRTSAEINDPARIAEEARGRAHSEFLKTRKPGETRSTEQMDAAGTALLAREAAATDPNVRPSAAKAAAAAAPTGPKTRQDWLDQMKGDMGEEAFRKVGTYTDEVMAPMGTSGPGANTQFFGSATSRARGDHISTDADDKSRKPMTGLQGPGTLISSGDLAASPYDQSKGASLDLNEYLQRMKDTRAAQGPPLPTGPSGQRQGLDQRAQHENLQAITPAAATPDQRDTAQKLSSDERERDSGGNEKLASAIDSLNSKLEGLSELKLDTSEITAGLTTVATAVTTLGTKTLKVSVDGTVPVTVENTEAFKTATGEVQGTGADVTALAESIKAVTGIQESQTKQLTDHNTRISANLTADGNQDKAIEKLQDDTKAIDPEVIRTQITTETATAREAINQSVTEQITAVDGRVVANTTLIGTVKTTAEEAKTTADGFAEDIKTASDNAITAKDTATDAKEVADATKLVADAATVTATDAKTAADKATGAIATINGVVETNRNNIENNVRTVEGNVKTNKDGVKTNRDNIVELRSDLTTVRGTADSANSRVNAPR